MFSWEPLVRCWSIEAQNGFKPLIFWIFSWFKSDLGRVLLDAIIQKKYWPENSDNLAFMQISVFMQTSRMQIRVLIWPEFSWWSWTPYSRRRRKNKACLALEHMHPWIHNKMTTNSSTSGPDLKILKNGQKWRLFLRFYWMYSVEGKHSIFEILSFPTDHFPFQQLWSIKFIREFAASLEKSLHLCT